MVGLVPGDEVLALVIRDWVGGGALLDLGFDRAEGGGGFEHEVVGLRVGVRGEELVDDDRALGRVAGLEHLAEANESVHFVQVAAHLGFQPDELGDVVVGFELEQIALSLQAVEEPVEEVPPLRVAVDGGELRGFEEVFGGVRLEDGWAGGGVLGVKRKGEGCRRGCVLQVELFRAVAGVQCVAGRGAPGFEVGRE